MEIKPIKNESDYQQALAGIERLMEAELNTPEGDKLDILTTLVEAYEASHYPIDPPDPIRTELDKPQGISRFRNAAPPSPANCG